MHIGLGQRYSTSDLPYKKEFQRTARLCVPISECLGFLSQCFLSLFFGEVFEVVRRRADCRASYWVVS